MEDFILLLAILIFGLPILLFFLTRSHISAKSDRLERKITKLSDDVKVSKTGTKVWDKPDIRSEVKHLDIPSPKSREEAFKREPEKQSSPTKPQDLEQKPIDKTEAQDEPSKAQPSSEKKEEAKDHEKYMPGYNQEKEKKKPEKVDAANPVYPQPIKETTQKTENKKSKKSFSEKYPDMEKFIGENLINKIGIAILVLGIGFFVKYAIDNNWINEVERVMVGILSGGLLLGFAHYIRKSFKSFSSVLVGGGLSIFYFTIAIAFHEYGLLSQTAAFVVMTAITGFSILLSIAYDRKELAVLAIIGGFSSPFMVSGMEGNYIALLTYITILNIGTLVLAYFKKWNILNILSYLATIFIYGSWVYAKVFDVPDAPYIGALVFGTIYYITFFIMNIINNVKEDRKFNAGEISILISNTFLYFTAGLTILSQVHNGDYQGLFTALVGTFNFIFAFTLYKNNRVDKNLVFLLIGLTLTFFSLAAPIQLEGNRITLFWALEAVLLLWLSQKSRIQLIKQGAVVVMFLMLISLVMDWVNIYGGNNSNEVLSIIFNQGFITSMVSIFSIVATIFLLKKETNESLFWELDLSAYKSLLKGILVGFFYLSMLLELQYQLSQYIDFTSTRTMILGGYNLFYLAAMILLTNKKLYSGGFNWSICLGIIGILSYILYYHNEIIYVRNEYLVGSAVGLTSYLFHYVVVAAVLTILALGSKNIRQNYGLRSDIGQVFLWFTGIVLVFVVSLELDHLVLLNNYLPGASISHIISQNHKIGYPILWGLCSFGFMFLGMKKNIKDLRIISLTLFFLTLCKLFLYDIIDISEGGKIVAFISLGVLLLIVSFMYQKLKNLILEDNRDIN